MKRTMISMLMIASCFSVINAQLIVDDNGHVAVGIDTESAINSTLSVNGVGLSTTSVYVKSEPQHEYGTHVLRTENYPSSASKILSAYSATTTVFPIHQNFGMIARTYCNTPTNSGRAYGICGQAGNSTSGWNFGVCGTLLGSLNGTGIYGSSVNENKGVYIGGRYAGYFHGEVKVTSTLTAAEIVTLSDYRVKENVKALNNSSSLDNLMNMNVVEYNYNENMIAPI